MSDKFPASKTSQANVKVYTSRLQLEDGHKLAYTSVGDDKKPLLLLVIGSSGLGSLYHRLSIELSAHFRCVCYDKRGFLPRRTEHAKAASQRNPFIPTERHVEDAAALVTHLSPCMPAYVFGTSTGGTAVLDLTIRYPELVHTAILHEPITFSVIRDIGLREEMLALYRRIGSMENPVEAFPIFAKYMFNPPQSQDTKSKITTNGNEKPHTDQSQSMPSNPTDIYNGRQGHKEAIAMVEYIVDELKARENSNKLIIVCGMESKDQQVSKPGQALAQALREKRIWELAGDHMSFASKNVAATFAQHLLFVLHQEGRISLKAGKRTSHI